MKSQKIYTITLDDDPIVSKLITKATNLPTLTFTKSSSLISRSKSYNPIALFVDVHLGIEDSGIDSIPLLREIWAFIPIIVVTGNERGELVGQALAAGANDYIRKPINVSELRARLSARIAEMNARKAQDTIHSEDLILTKLNQSLTRGNSTIYLPKLEFQLILSLVQSANSVIPRQELKRKLWGSLTVSENALDKKISHLKMALKDLSSNWTIRSVYGKGVIFEKVKT